MPVWHEQLAPYREAGTVQLIGIAQEQHPERCELYRTWKEFDWPILWDPFNVTGAKVVPNHIVVDEHGIVRSTRARGGALEELLKKDFPAPKESRPVQARAPRLLEVAHHDSDSFFGRHYAAMSDLLWRVPGKLEAAVETLEDQAYERPDDALLAFRAGVARRMRYDSAKPQADDFQAALDHWARALDIDPNQYIWRRRIQQYGPRMDKPYPFYTWVQQASKELLERGVEPIALRADLTPAELAQRGGWSPQDEVDEPDPNGRIQRDTQGWIRIEGAAAFDTQRKKPVASVHLAFRPSESPSAHWNNEAGPMQVWIGSGELPEGWKVERRLLEIDDVPPGVVSSEVRRVSFEVELPPDAVDTTLAGYALFYVCEDEEGTCLYLRKDFTIELQMP